MEKEVGAMPGVFQQSVDRATDAAVRARDSGLPAVLLFGLPERKDELGSEAYASDGIVQQTVMLRLPLIRATP